MNIFYRVLARAKLAYHRHEERYLIERQEMLIDALRYEMARTRCVVERGSIQRDIDAAIAHLNCRAMRHSLEADVLAAEIGGTA